MTVVVTVVRGSYQIVYANRIPIIIVNKETDMAI